MLSVFSSLFAEDPVDAVRIIIVFEFPGHDPPTSFIILLPTFPLPPSVISFLKHLRDILSDGPVRSFTWSALVSW